LEGVLLAARAIIVTFQSEHVIEKCLRALTNMAPSLPATVIDNASLDRTLEFVHTHIIANKDNRGFAGAVNQGVRASHEDVLIVLNPDVEVQTPLEPLIAAAAQYGMSAGLLLNEQGQPQTGFTIRRLPTPAALALELLGTNRLWPTNPVNRRYRYLDRDLTLSGDVEQPAGAFLAIRRDVWETLGGLDESFHPVWFEDVDFCARARSAGYRIWFVPEVRATHLGGHSVNRLPGARRTRLWYGSLLRYAAKHFSPLEYRIVCLAAFCSAVPRMMAGIVRERSLAPLTTFIDILSFVGRRLVSGPEPTEWLG
jgi:N-acetylglucosaminyl-diphospho-decaprenol L-rhamnosyltransferase